MVLPVFVLGIGFAAVIMRHTRSAMLTSLNSDYVRSARARGLGTRAVLGRHALRNSLITVVTVTALHLGALISGAVIIETVFNIPGFGTLTLMAVQRRDYPLIEGIVLVTAAAFVIASLLADLAYSYLNPRIRAS
jgi:peptide/nickel transport system permease protein